MIIKKNNDIPSHEITEEKVYLARREFLKHSALAGSLALSGLPMFSACSVGDEAQASQEPNPEKRLENVLPAPPRYRVEGEPLTPKWDATHYNNFYELGTGKEDPARNAGSLKTEPWSVVIEGEVAKPGRVPLEEILRPHPLEERIYRLRCVEAWSMIIPWIGIPLGDVLKRFEPTSKARFVSFETLYDPAQLPGQKRNTLPWPYREGLRMDEAMHPLSLLAVGMYGETLPGQNGAPLRLVVPWKYGFKSIKSIVRIRLQEDEPITSWSQENPSEYGFYANVNPEVSHPRWSQARERRIGEWSKRPTLPFNGYADQVASLYAGMDLKRSY
ncbi:MAG: protein-methionine-sulfoxide reductase catalytic subunit MsrP [Myxococcota bacterium]|nr:protein-methionine-sulfoxide reductase catalytic subunit MsrP [Myxococcota bacterium]